MPCDLGTLSMLPRSLCGHRRGRFRANGAGQQTLESSDVVVSHARGGETLFKAIPHPLAADGASTSDGADSLVERMHDQAGVPILDDLGRRAMTPGNHGRSSRHRLDHHKAKGLGPVDGKEERKGIAEKITLLLLVDLADELDQRIVEQGLDFLL